MQDEVGARDTDEQSLSEKPIPMLVCNFEVVKLLFRRDNRI